MAMPWIYAVRFVQIIFGLIILGLSAYVISSFSYWWSYSNTVNFFLFLSCWTTFVATPYLLAAPIYFPRLAHHFVIPAVEVITMIFWFSGFIAMGALLPSPSYCTWGGCRAMQAATVFGAFEWVLFVVSTYFAVIDLKNHRYSGESGESAQGAQGAQKTQHNVQLGV